VLGIRVNRREGATRIELLGHADFAPRGKDVVCAAAAAIVDTALLGLEALAKAYPDHVTFEADEAP
jgi:uncharacterized protein YsxB (DUF464 family)